MKFNPSNLAHKNILIVTITALVFVTCLSFVQILDKTQINRKKKIEFIVVHYTANLNPGANARMNALYLRKKQKAGTHYCVDDKEIIQCTKENQVAYAVGDRKWLGFIPKPWLKNKVYNQNSLSYEMCLGGGRNDSLILDKTAQLVGWQLVNKGLDISHLVRHHDVTGKHCPKFLYTKEWNQQEEDRQWWIFKTQVMHYQNIHLKRKEMMKAKQNLGESTLAYQVK